MWFRENIEKMAGYVPGDQPGDASVVKLNTNENPYPPSPAVFKALSQIDEGLLRRYPVVTWDAFREVAARVHGCDPETIVCGNGADELLTMLLRCCCDEKRALVYPVPSYSLYPILGQIQGCQVIELAFGEDYSLPPALAAAEAHLTFLCNPNAPSGTFVPVEAVAELAGKIKGVLAIDEAYVDFAEDNCLGLVEKFENVIVLRSMSKGYSLAGLRFGYGIGSRRIVEAMCKVKDSYNVNALTQRAVAAALADQGYFQENVAKIKAQRQRLMGALGQMGFAVWPSQANFLLVETQEPSAKEIYEKLVARGVDVRDFDEAGMWDKLRITVGSAQENDALLEALKEPESY